MTLTVFIFEPHQDGHRELQVERDIVAIRAFRFDGAGDAAIYYQGRDAAGTWYALRKDHNPGKRLPQRRDFTTWTRSLTAVRGTRGLYKLTSEEIILPAEEER